MLPRAALAYNHAARGEGNILTGMDAPFVALPSGSAPVSPRDSGRTCLKIAISRATSSRSV
jgi:hypothetical protein